MAKSGPGSRKYKATALGTKLHGKSIPKANMTNYSAGPSMSPTAPRQPSHGIGASNYQPSAPMKQPMHSSGTMSPSAPRDVSGGGVKSKTAQKGGPSRSRAAKVVRK